jgi:NAD(P)H-quinone oxidoreductase subunit 5
MAAADFLPLTAPMLLVAVAVSMRPAASLRAALARARLATLGGLGLAALSGIQLAVFGPHTSALIGVAGFGLSIRLDALSLTMLALVSFIGVIIQGYSRNYLAGEAEQARFTRWLLLTLAAVQMLVLSGNLVQLCMAWTLTSLALHRLLVFYPERRAARLAATKKFWSARAGDLALICGAVLLARQFGTTDIATILDAAASAPAGLVAPAALIAVAAALKSGMFPSHGWLIEVMETPTPVSALLHAGIVNAGGFLVIRFADVMVTAPGVLHGLALIGGFTALLGAVVMLTQPSIKVSLAWSTVSQMGFMLLQCGLGAFGVATLHIVAHSLYKAHAFLSSGSVVDRARAPANPAFGMPVRPLDAVAGLGLAAASIILVGGLFGHSPASAPALMGLAVISVIGMSMFVTQSLGGSTRRAMLGRAILMALGTATAWFSAQAAVAALFANTLPPAPAPGPAGLAVIVLAVISFAAVALAQLTASLWLTRPTMQALRIHLAHGLYANLLWNRLIGAHRLTPRASLALFGKGD